METPLRADILSLKNSCSTKDFRSAIETLLTLHRNALEQPDEEKVRRLRKNNPKIHETLWRYQAARMFLQHAGWIEDPEDDSRLLLLASAEQLIQAVDVLLEHRHDRYLTFSHHFEVVRIVWLIKPSLWKKKKTGW